MTDGDDLVEAAVAELYALPPEEFMSRRTALAKQAKQAKADGGSAAGKAIANLRKPTVAAAVVNRWVHEQSDVVERLTELGDELRRAHHDLDAGAMRELSTRRRGEVAEIADAALGHAEIDDPSTGLRDEVIGTFDAAVADPEITARLGRLVRSEQFSGFGMSGTPELTLVQGGKHVGGAGSAAKAAPATDAVPAATKRRLTRARDRAQADLDAADKRQADAESDEAALGERIGELQDELAELQKELEQARREHDQARKVVKSERTKRRSARSALDRAERALEK